MTPSGTCTNGASRTRRGGSRRTFVEGEAAACSFSKRPASHSRGLSGSALQNEPSTTSMGGSSACSPRARTDLAVPRFPAMQTPPSPPSTAPSSSASLMKSAPTTAVSGKERRCCSTGT